MNPFEEKLLELAKGAEEIQKKELDLKHEATVFNATLAAFLKEHGLAENFTLPQMALLAIRKSRA